jgi:hypothetical protein
MTLGCLIADTQDLIHHAWATLILLGSAKCRVNSEHPTLDQQQGCLVWQPHQRPTREREALLRAEKLQDLLHCSDELRAYCAYLGHDSAILPCWAHLIV